MKIFFQTPTIIKIKTPYLFIYFVSLYKMPSQTFKFNATILYIFFKKTAF